MTTLQPRQAEQGHVPVMLDEAIDGLALHAGGSYIDATFGGGGHSSAILDSPAGIGTLLAIDADRAAVQRAATMAEAPAVRSHLIAVQGNFGDLVSITNDAGLTGVDGILFDLGLSSFQLDEGDRGFSFRFNAPLDMRFDVTGPVTAAGLVNESDEAALADLIYRYGEERQSRRIARAIVRARTETPIETTGQLAAVVEGAVGGRRGRAVHPATRMFQALRIAVNRELDVLERGLDAALQLLRADGRLVVISFHSLEDRIVKHFIDRAAATCVCPPEQPVCTCDTVPALRRVSKAIRPSELEVLRNPRSRSAVLRVAERVAPASNV